MNQEKDYESFKIAIPVPAGVLSPNCTIGTIGGRFMKASSIKRHRKIAREAIRDAEIETMPWGCVSVDVRIFYRTNRTRDEDNAMGSLKSYYDGIVDSGLVADDDKSNMVRTIPELLLDDKSPRVEMTLMRMPREIQ